MCGVQLAARLREKKLDAGPAANLGETTGTRFERPRVAVLARSSVLGPHVQQRFDIWNCVKVADLNASSIALHVPEAASEPHDTASCVRAATPTAARLGWLRRMKPPKKSNSFVRSSGKGLW